MNAMPADAHTPAKHPRRLTLRRVLLVVALGLTACLGTAWWWTRESLLAVEQKPTKPRSAAIGPSVGQEPTEDDAQVCSASLIAFLESMHSINDDERNRVKALVVHTQTNGPSGWISPGQVASELDRENWGTPDDLGERLSRRNTRAEPSAPLVSGEGLRLDDLSKYPKGERFEMEFLEHMEKRHPGVRHYVYLWKPAYYQSGQRAVVRFSFGPTAHGACTTYLLAKEGGRWKVLKERLSHYA